MKIAYLLLSFPNVSETFIINEIIGLKKLGHEIHIFSLVTPQTDVIHESVVENRLLNQTHYLHLSAGRWDAYRTFLKYATRGICYRPLPLVRYLLSRGRHLKGSFTRFNLLMVPLPFFAERFDLVHAHFSGRAADAALSVWEATRIPFVFTAHAADIFVDIDLERFVLKCQAASKIITISEFNRRYLIDLLGNEYARKFEVVHCGIDLDRFCPVARSPNRVPVVLCVGRLVEKKGITFLVRAIAQLAKYNIPCRLNIVGEGPMKAEIRNLIGALGVSDRISLLGAQPQSRVIEEMNKAEIFSLPSVTASDGNKEGVPVALMEAQAMELPTVSTHHSGISEVVIDGQTGFLVPERDVDALSDKIHQLIENPDLRLSMGKAGRLHISTHYNIHTEVKKLEAIHRMVRSSRKSPL